LKRLPYTDAFVDESIRGQRYLMACVLVQARDLAPLRSEVAQLASGVAPRVHFNNDTAKQKRRVLDAISQMPIEVFAVSCRKDHGTNDFRARAACVSEIVRQLQTRQVGRLVLESRQDDADDRRVITRTRARTPALIFDHRNARSERMLWVADAAAWAVGAGGPWQLRIEAVLGDVFDVVP
jgi:hypothetical protein